MLTATILNANLMKEYSEAPFTSTAEQSCAWQLQINGGLIKKIELHQEFLGQSVQSLNIIKPYL